MKIVRVARFGGPEVLQISDTPAPRPDRGQVLVAVEAAGVGFVDVMARQGSYGPIAKPGYIPGVEVAGTIVDVGSEEPGRVKVIQKADETRARYEKYVLKDGILIGCILLGSRDNHGFATQRIGRPTTAEEVSIRLW